MEELRRYEEAVKNLQEAKTAYMLAWFQLQLRSIKERRALIDDFGIYRCDNDKLHICSLEALHKLAELVGVDTIEQDESWNGDVYDKFCFKYDGVEIMALENKPKAGEIVE